MSEMKINNTNLSFQPRGEQLLGVVTGEPADLERQFFSLYNHGATGGEPQFLNNGTMEFWTSKTAMRDYFKNRLWGFFRDRHIKRCKKKRLAIRARYRALGYHDKYARDKAKNEVPCKEEDFEDSLNRLAARHFKSFQSSRAEGQRTFSTSGWQADDSDGFSMGYISPEKPDEKEENETSAFRSASLRDDSDVNEPENACI